MAHEIGQIFKTPQQSAEVIENEYYLPFQKSKNGLKKVSECCSLIDKVYAIRRELIKYNCIPPEEILSEVYVPQYSIFISRCDLYFTIF